jgi:ribulose-5-phosphate 4-epimerase/fuculose-1-phosphate aldolase
MTGQLSEESKLRNEIVSVGKSLFDRGLTFGSTGNISARLTTGELLMTPTNASLGNLEPDRLSKFSAEGVENVRIAAREAVKTAGAVRLCLRSQT